MGKLTLLSFLFLVIAALNFVPELQIHYGNKKSGNADLTPVLADIEHLKNKDISIQVSSGVTHIQVNGLSELNNKTKEEIYELRKFFVSKSIFNNASYSPDENIFGQIESNKPWIGIKAMNYRWIQESIPEGLSEESRFINNPSALVMLNMAYKNVTYGRHFDQDMYLLPKTIAYYRGENTIKIIYSLERFIGELRNEFKTTRIYTLDGTNARDFGFQWVYAYNTNNVSFDNDSVKDIPQMFMNFFHLGHSAGYPGGCNNGSPYQQELNFAIIRLPAHIYLKLWKMPPSSADEKADISLDLIFS